MSGDATDRRRHGVWRARAAGGFRIALLGLVLGMAGCSHAWNNPYPDAKPRSNTLYSSFAESPRHLDLAQSYSADEAVFTSQIYEPPLQYQYLLRPYQLVPLTATEVPKPVLMDKSGKPLGPNPPPGAAAFSVWTIHIKPGIRYQPHPAFARDDRGQPLYDHLTDADLAGIRSPGDFAHQGTKELIAADYVYEIKRLAAPGVHSPIYSLMADHIAGFADFTKRAQKAATALKKAKGEDAFLDLSSIPMAGVKVINRYTYQIKLDGRYPQFRYWLALPFFGPLPKAVDRFYSQPILARHNMTLDQFPVGTGPYMLTENDPNRRMVLTRNPNFHLETYPTRGESGDHAAGLLADAGKRLPFINRAVFSLEKEDIPRWNKFLQGYYDNSGISSDSFNQAIRIGDSGGAHISPSMKRKGIKLETTVSPSIFYMGFNMMDSVVGGESERARKLRRAISIAVDFKEFVSIFLNDRGIVAQGPIPPGITGHQSGKDGFNHYLFQWQDGHAERRSLQAAKELLAEAGYPDGIDRKTGQPLTLHLDVTGSGPDSASQMNWYRKQFGKLNIQLVIRATTYNRFQEKMAQGDDQIFFFGWNADYPDPENFLFLLYGPNGQVKHHGENAANYENPTFDRLFVKMRDMPDGPAREAVIKRMVHIVRRDAPWVWGFYPKSFALHHGWVYNGKPNSMANNTLKYLRLNPALRARRRAQWNGPVLWPLPLAGGALVLLIAPAAWTFRRRSRRRGRGRQ